MVYNCAILFPKPTPRTPMPEATATTKESMRAVAREEWLNILREEFGDEAPATIGDIRRIVREAIREDPAAFAPGHAHLMTEADMDAIAQRTADLIRRGSAKS